MKRPLIFFSCIIVPFSLLAQTGQMAVEISGQSTEQITSSTKFEIEFNQAKSLYDKRQFGLAYQAFMALWYSYPNSLVINFYLGITALELKRYDEAMAAFDRVLILNPEHARTRLELARLYYETGDFQMANNELEIALRADLPEPVRNNVLALKAKMEKEQSRHSHAFTLVLGMNYDSNANNDIGDSNRFDLPGFGGIELSGNTLQDDIGFAQTLVYSHGYDFGERGGWSLNSQVVGFNKLNKEVGRNNVQYVGVSTIPAYSYDMYSFVFPFEADRIFIDNAGYMSNLSVGAGLSQMLSPTQQLNADIKLRNMFYDTSKERNALASIYALGYRHALGVNPFMLGVTASFENRDKTGTFVQDNASLTEKVLKIDGSRTLSARWRMNASLGIRQTHYKAESNLFLSKRQDTIKKLDVGIMYQLDRKSLLSGTFGYASHDSNQGPYKFDKTMFGLNYMLRF